MAEMQQVYNFAVKWVDKFRDQNINYLELVDHYMADDCESLEFEMDCGHAFSEKYGDAVNDSEELDRIIDSVDDIMLLGSAIYSRWRYFNHWAYTGAEILEPKNRAWFILALSRLAILSGSNPFIFQGNLQKIHIISNNIGYGTPPEPDEEVEQHITINADGRVWFSAYHFGDVLGKYQKARSQQFKIDKDSADCLISAFASYFGNEYEEVFATDIGNWMMEMTNTDGVVYKFRGSLCANFSIDGTDLSDMVRDLLDMDDLYVFDGNNKPDIIDKITLDYHRVTKIKPNHIPDGAIWEYVTWDYSEHLIIDRTTETFEYIQNIGTGCKISHKYEIEGGIESLFEIFDSEDLFAHIEGNPNDVGETPNETKDYKITIDYKRRPQRIITGSFDKNGLPDDFADFADAVFDLISFYGLGEILDPSVYNKVKLRSTEYIFCSVEFEEGQKSYYYIADEDSLEIGDYVVVPAGKDNHHVVVEVVNIEYFTQETAPFPIEKTKHIVRKCTEDDLISPEVDG